MNRVTFRVPPDLLDEVDELARAEFDGNRSDVARAALEAFVEDATDTSPVVGSWEDAEEHAVVGGPVRDPTLRTDGGRDVDEWAAEAWHEVGHMAVWLLFMNATHGLEDALWPVEQALQEGRRVDETAIRSVRRRIDELRDTLETYVAPLSPGVEPWDGGAGSTVPYRVMADQLENSGFAYEVERPGE